MEKKNLCFIIAHRYYRNYKSFLKYYIDNINKFYENSLIIIVDNNSKHLEDIRIMLGDFENIVILTNETNSKFEPGAYNVGIRYVLDHELDYKYYIFTQDNFVLKNKFDFNDLEKNGIVACALNHFTEDCTNWNQTDDTCQRILRSIHVSDRTNEFNLCWCNSFILHHSRLETYYEIMKNEIVTTRLESEKFERYQSGILFYLNNMNYRSIGGDIKHLHLDYDCWKVHVENDDSIKAFFVKTVQQKNEHTPEN